MPNQESGPDPDGVDRSTPSGSEKFFLAFPIRKFHLIGAKINLRAIESRVAARSNSPRRASRGVRSPPKMAAPGGAESGISSQVVISPDIVFL